LFIRLYWGIQLAQNGWAKLHNLSRVTEYFSSLGVPAPAAMAPFISTVEFLCGILLVVGLFSRFVGLVLAIDMLNAYVFGDRAALLSIFSDSDKFTAAAPYNYLLTALLILIFGPGLIALDTYLLKKYPCPAASDQGPAK
jgi:putative oxidoreductase